MCSCNLIQPTQEPVRDKLSQCAVSISIICSTQVTTLAPPEQKQTSKFTAQPESVLVGVIDIVGGCELRLLWYGPLTYTSIDSYVVLAYSVHSWSITAGFNQSSAVYCVLQLRRSIV